MSRRRAGGGFCHRRGLWTPGQVRFRAGWEPVGEEGLCFLPPVGLSQELLSAKREGSSAEDFPRWRSSEELSFPGSACLTPSKAAGRKSRPQR